MSLLLEALKKAERAKEEAQRAARAGDSLSLEGVGTPFDDARKVITRGELPDISGPMSIQAEDLELSPSPAPAQNAVPSPAAAPVRAATGDAARRATAAATDQALAADRSTAKKVFEAKFREPNPRMPFYVALALLGSFAAGTVIYFWLQLRPAPPLVNPNPPRSAAEAVSAVPPTSAPANSASAVPGLPPTAGANPAAAIPGLPPVPVSPGRPPTAGAATTPAPAAPITPRSQDPAPVPGVPSSVPRSPAPSAGPAAARTSVPSPPATPRVAAGAGRPSPTQSESAPGSPARRAPGPPRTREPDTALAVNRGGASVDPRVDAAFSDYQSGRVDAARAGYAQVLRDDPGNRDAMRGMAAVEARLQRPDAAESLYQRLLQIDPRDSHAQASLLSLRGDQIDPVAAESRLKSLLASDPESNALNAALGAQYARQGRWPEAQQAFFKAFAADPENPDHAYNLAVSLEHVRQPRVAADYYRRAASLAERRSASFDPARAQSRAETLSR